MSTIQASIRTTETKGQVNLLREKGQVPGIVYGGENPNEKIWLSKYCLSHGIKKWDLDTPPWKYSLRIRT